MRRQSKRKEHILQEAANSLFTDQRDREELCWQVREALDRDRQLPADTASKIPSLCAICEACGQSGCFKVLGQRDEVYRFFHTLHNSFDSKHITDRKIHVFADGPSCSLSSVSTSAPENSCPTPR